MASPIVKGQAFGTTETVTAAKLQNIVDNAAFKDFDGSTEVFNVSGSTDIGTCVLAGGLAVKTSTGQLQIKDNGVTLAKMATQADQTVLGNVSGGTAVPTAVPIVGGTGILINDDALGTSDTKGATQGNIKAYVDGGGGFTPTTVSSGQKSVTLPNGLIMKFGTASSTSDTAQTFDFTDLGHTDFPNECLNLSLGGMMCIASNVNTSGFTINRLDSLNGSFTFFWQAIGR